ncbi:MAG: hypothetical protein Unbinned7358contig1001_4 [Prokaryotic dsDNA virus sp.]|nr:MAG: hypothetical protein Unbinned7358contig1001_4 [Prokaryotic dsDNA virus sp.]|tara:strand:+ start:3933 stop:4151 length:219 start_codon:yes stop_codon:yes gene_type:complete
MDDSRDILLALGRLEGKVESLIHMQRSHAEEMDRIDKRVRVLEQGRAALLGGAAVVGSVAATIISWIFKEWA